ncbi:MAG TPA: DUF5615 family PIN-like protein [Thermoanaerobaculia bacterium]|nr:DUF5615 family PIN-like protein [Thermoanaerobaculia bacterium]
MRILIDECVPRALKRHLRAYDVVLTVPEAGFAGLKNGQLLREAEGNFDTFITTDKSLAASAESICMVHRVRATARCQQ